MDFVFAVDIVVFTVNCQHIIKSSNRNSCLLSGFGQGSASTDRHIFILYFVDCASQYIRVRKTNLMHNVFLVYFVNLYMFRAYLGPSSGGTTVCIQQLVFIILLDDSLLSWLDWLLFQPGQ